MGKIGVEDGWKVEDTPGSCRNGIGGKRKVKCGLTCRPTGSGDGLEHGTR
jgi:hypothetical protein